jgi:hypothetical protein
MEREAAVTAHYRNTPTVVVVFIPLWACLLTVRRALAGEGDRRLALPGDYQMLGQTWQEAGAQEETGIVVSPAAVA